MTFTDICTKVYFLTSTNSVSFPIAPLTVEANNALDRVVSLILQADTRWQFDDTNNTDLPIGTTGLTTDQQDYTLATTHLEIIRVEVQDTQSNWIKLVPIDQADLYDQSLTDYLKASGVPAYYDKIGASVFLYPKPNYTQSASLKLYFKRGPSYFIVSDTTKTPGFNSLFHDLVAYWTAYNFAVANGKSNAGALMSAIQMREQALLDEYSLRDKDDHLSITARQPRSGQSWFR